MKVFDGIITSSFCFIPRLSNDTCNTAVAEETPHANLLSVNSANFFSNTLTFSPNANLPSFNANDILF